MHLDTALALMEEMRSRNIQANTHTFSSLLNVCVKAGQLNMALGVYNEVRRCTTCQALVVAVIDICATLSCWHSMSTVQGYPYDSIYRACACTSC